MNVKNRKAEQSEATRSALIEAARGLFSERGYASVSTEEIVQSAGVTRGALYHHFRDKKDLFAEVVEQLEQELLQKIATTALGESDPWAQQLVAVGAFLDGCLDPAVQRVILTDAPSVLGLHAWREVEARYGLALVRTGLQSMIDAGLIEQQPLEPLAHMMLGALQEGGLLIAHADDPVAARREVGEGVERILRGLRVAEA
jgi:AcrR family transcriptional regulator